MYGYIGAIGLVSNTYSILNKATSLSDKIGGLIRSSELTQVDKLNFEALQRRVKGVEQTLSYVMIHKYSQQDHSDDEPHLVQYQVSNSLLVRPMQMAEKFLVDINLFIEKILGIS